MAGPLPPGMLDLEGGAAAEARAAFLMRLRARGVRDVAVLRAMESVSRAGFVDPRYAAYVNRDIALPIGCGQTLPEPAFVGATLEALACAPGHRVFQVGAGSGFATTLLSRLCGEVVAVERFRSLAAGAKARLAAVGAGNAAVLWGDGLLPQPDLGRFDRIVLHAAVDRLPEHLTAMLAPEGVIVFVERSPRDRDGLRGQTLVRLSLDASGAMSRREVRAARLQLARRGRAETM